MDEEADRRRYEAPYTTSHPVPSIQRYHKTKEARRNHAVEEKEEDLHKIDDYPQDDNASANKKEDDINDGSGMKDTSELSSSGTAKDRRKVLKKRKDERAERVVTDPVTHLPVRIHDFTSESLEKVAKNDAAYGSTPRTATGLSNKEKSSDQLKSELEEIARGQAALQAEFPPPAYELVHRALVKVSTQSTIIVAVGITLILAVTGYAFWFSSSVELCSLLNGRISGKVSIVVVDLLIALLAALSATLLVYTITNWADRRIQSLWDAALWHGKFDDIAKDAEHHETETTVWLNSLLAAVWPLINPDLFTSLSDTLEDVMQASLPSVVRMVSVDDIGQGSEALRILGVRWLPTAAAARAVSEDGDLQSASTLR